MKDNIRDELQAIDDQTSKIIRQLTLSVKPLAKAIDTVLATFGQTRGSRLLGHRRRECRLGDLIIVQHTGAFSDNEIHVYHEEHLVLKFNSILPLMGSTDFMQRRYLFVYKPGPWEQMIVDLYRKARLANLKNDYDAIPETLGQAREDSQ